MSEVIPFTGNTAVAIPDYFADIFGDQSNIPPKLSVPQLSIKGGKFRIILEGEETVMTRPDPETNEQMPLTSVRLVVLNMSKRSARSYYKEKYSSENLTPPACFSLDGEKPDPTAAEPQAKTCASCPQAQKGSKVSEASGKAISACTMHRRLVVVPAAKLDFEPLLMRLAPTSAWDKNNEANEAQNWFAWQQYLDFIAARGIKHTAQLVTMVKFDTNVEYPKLLFKPDRFLTPEEAIKLKNVWNGEKARALLEAKEQDAIGAHEVVEPVEQFQQEAEPAPKVEEVTRPKAEIKPKAEAKAKPKEQPAPEPEKVSVKEETANPGREKLMAVLDEW